MPSLTAILAAYCLDIVPCHLPEFKFVPPDSLPVVMDLDSGWPRRAHGLASPAENMVELNQDWWATADLWLAAKVVYHEIGHVEGLEHYQLRRNIMDTRRSTPNSVNWGFLVGEFRKDLYDLRLSRP
jgi:hypothetical protein